MVEEKQLYGALTVYRERGYYLRRLENFEQAKDAHNEAFEYMPDDVRNLIGRSRVYDEAIQPERALADAELALRLQPNNMIARYMQARALYTMTEFERALVLNYRSICFRKQPPYFKESISQGLETIQNCIGVHAGKVMLDSLPVVKQQEALKVTTTSSAAHKALHKCRIPQFKIKNELTQTEARKRLTLSRVIAMKYLGPMADDKFFLENLVKDRRIKSANAKGSVEIQNLAKKALRSIINQQELLRTQRPYYTVKLAEKTASKYQTKFKETILEYERIHATRISEKLMGEIEKCLKNNKVMNLMSKAEQFQTYLDSKTNKTLPDKNSYLDRLYRAVGEAYLSQHRLSYTLSEKSNRRRISFLMGLSIGRTTSYDSVLANYRHVFTNKDIAIEKLKSTLDMCENPNMKCWLLYELSKLLCSKKSYSTSKYYAKRCQAEAQRIGNVTWWLNGCFVLMSGDMQQGNSSEVYSQIEEACQWSKKMADPMQVQAFLRKCAEMAEETVSIDATKTILHREKKILSVMNEDQRVNTEVLFKRMSTVPPGRRFNVVPIEKTFSDDKSERYKRKQKGLTIIPGPTQSLPESL